MSFAYADRSDCLRSLGKQRRNERTGTLRMSILVAVLPDACLFMFGSLLFFVFLRLGWLLCSFCRYASQKWRQRESWVRQYRPGFIAVPANNLMCSPRKISGFENHFRSVGVRNSVLGRRLAHGDLVILCVRVWHVLRPKHSFLGYSRQSVYRYSIIDSVPVDAGV